MRLPAAIEKLQLALGGEWLLRSPSQLRCVAQSGATQSVGYARDRRRSTTDRSICSPYCIRNHRRPGTRPRRGKPPRENLRSSTFPVSTRSIPAPVGIHRRRESPRRAPLARPPCRAVRARAAPRGAARQRPFPYPPDSPEPVIAANSARQVGATGRSRCRPRHGGAVRRAVGRAASAAHVLRDGPPTPTRPVVRRACVLFVRCALRVSARSAAALPSAPARLSVVHLIADCRIATGAR
jgi:hypothetical protein